MNKAITEGLVLTPPKFEAGLDVWSSGDGTPGSDTYDGAANAAFVPADQDFGGCLELVKTQPTQKLRWMGETPILPGCYLRVQVRVKALSGNLPDVRIAGWAGGAGGAHIGGLVEVGPARTVERYGEIVEVSAIVGTGARFGVDMAWGRAPLYGHFGLDLTGANGGVVRVDDIVIEDVTSAFLRDLMDWVDVRDYGAIGDGTTDDQPAFEAADAAANGRTVLVPEGTYHLADHVTFENPVRFVGTVTLPEDKRLQLTKNFDLPTYIDAFGSELLALRKAIQALFNFSDHDGLDLGGRQISVEAPIDMHATVANKDTYNIRRVIRNGQFDVVDGPAWADEVVTSQATYSPSNSLELTNVANIANIQAGSLVTGSGVGREVYVRAVNVGAQKLTLSQPLFDAAGTQEFTFTRFKYVLDFSGFSRVSRIVLNDIDIKCNGFASGIMLPPDGLIFHIRDCFFTRPKDRGITSIGSGCQGLLVDRCQFISNEQPARAQDRSTIALNVNANDAKIRDNRVVKFGHFAVLNGSGHMLIGNHWFQGDNEANGIRQAGVVFTASNAKSTVIGNYIDNSFIEWSNEHDAEPDFASELSFGGLSVTGNIFTANDVANWFNWIVVKPYGTGHFINGLSVTDNTFKSINGVVDQVDYVDNSFAGLDYNRMRNITWEGNAYASIVKKTTNPVVVSHTEASDSKTWQVDLADYLPFQGRARRVESVVAEGRITKDANTQVVDMPYVETSKGPQSSAVDIVWAEPCKGTVWLTARVDNPT
ncbi:glycosyl hydrolase family 28-related protein [Aliiroseovarius sp. YM-037]|uniref:glycosyl hydrolase family 28-related protein n=1 Tax=Aliiroseovarius sp. YM-037 TaxID=3341728 RepID=UPI003A811CDF